MTIDEGYIKYQSFWTRAPIPNASAAEELETWRRPLFDAGLIGEYEEHGIGYGNIRASVHRNIRSINGRL